MTTGDARNQLRSELYHTEGVDKGRVIDPDIAHEMAKIIDEHQSVNAQLDDQQKNWFSDGEKEAEIRGCELMAQRNEKSEFRKERLAELDLWRFDFPTKGGDPYRTAPSYLLERDQITEKQSRKSLDLSNDEIFEFTRHFLWDRYDSEDQLKEDLRLLNEYFFPSARLIDKCREEMKNYLQICDYEKYIFINLFGVTVNGEEYQIITTRGKTPLVKPFFVVECLRIP